MPMINDYKRKLTQENAKCVMCSKPLKDGWAYGIQIDYYPHSAGWKVDDFDDLQWLYVVCGSCDYQNSFDKLGIPRP